MKPYKINKRTERIPVWIKINIPLPKPKIPLKFFSKVHKPDVFVEFVFEEESVKSIIPNYQSSK